ncbi:MAG: SGNH/GDSL hydrolase family protein [Sphingomonas taxi]
MRRGGLRAAVLAAGGWLLLGTAPAPVWRTIWYAAPFPAIPALIPSDRRVFSDQTLRQTLIVEGEGSTIRLRLTNELGSAPLAVAAVTIGRIADDGGVANPLALRFAGQRDVRIPAGAPMLSDPLALPVRRGERLAVSVHYRAATPAAHLQPVELAPGDQTAVAHLSHAEAVRAPGIVSGVEAQGGTGPVVVAIGDSITEGRPEQVAAHRSWPQRLGERLRGVTIVNAGVSGSRLLKDGAGASLLARLDRDALTRPGVTAVILLIGVNDIGNGEVTGAPVTAAQLIAGYRQVVARAHGRGIRVIGATILPYRGAAYHSPAGEAVRRAVNDWVRHGGRFDGVIDFAAVVADPADASRLACRYDPGDHLHPNDAGYAAMAAAVPARLLTGR